MLFQRALLVLLLLSGCSGDTVAADARADAIPSDGAADLASPDVRADLPADLPATLDGAVIKDSTITCTSTVGTGSVSGTVNGQALSAVSAGGVRGIFMGLTGYGVALLDKPGTCVDLAQSMTAPKLWILVCADKPGTYAVGANCKGDAGAGAYLKNQVSIPSPGADPKASSGTVIIEAMSPDCGGKVKGSFSVSFGSDAVSGSFDTVGCGTINL